MSDKQEDYLIWQYRGKPKARQTVGLLLSESQSTFKSAVKLADILNIDRSTGWGLDLIGHHVGIERTFKAAVPREYFGWNGIEEAYGFSSGVFYRYGDSLKNSVVLNDDDYRFFIRAKIIKNYQSPDIAGITYSIRHLLGDQAYIIDNYDMTMNVVVPSTYLTDFRLFAIRELDILARPIGVSYKFLLVTNPKPFGWKSDSHSFGFSHGTFTRLINVNN